MFHYLINLFIYKQRISDLCLYNYLFDSVYVHLAPNMMTFVGSWSSNSSTICETV